MARNKQTEYSNNPEKTKNQDKLLSFLDFLKTFLIVILVGILLTVFVIQKNIVQGSSMVPTLQNGDQLFVEKISKYFSLERGDIVTVEHTDPMHPETLLIKRIIGLPGETVEIKDGHVYINGELLEESYLDDSLETTIDPRYDQASVTLAKDQYFIMGDNRPVSKDSRRIGPITKDQIIGKVLFRFYPFDDFGVPK